MKYQFEFAEIKICKNCPCRCGIHEDPIGRCEISGKFIRSLGTKPDDCPLQIVPENPISTFTTALLHVGEEDK